MWTNTCCSHPQHTEDELNMEPAFRGMKLAVIRRARLELGITDLAEEDLKIVSRILYYAECHS